MGQLRASKIYKDSKLLVLAVESIDTRYSKQNTSCQLYGSVKPIAIIVRSPEGMYALDMEARPTNLDQLKQDVAGLDIILRY